MDNNKISDVFYSHEDDGFIAVSDRFTYCSAYGNTAETAKDELRIAELNMREAKTYNLTAKN